MEIILVSPQVMGNLDNYASGLHIMSGEKKMKSFLKKIWAGIKAFSRKVAYVQSIIILTLFYFLVVGLFSVVIRILGKDLLNKKWKDKKKSYWIKKEKLEIDLENARRQF